MVNYKEQYKKKETKNWNWNVYVLACMVVTLDTAHFERSLLNAFAFWNAVQSSNHSITIIQQRKKREKEQIPKRKKKIGNNILVWYSLLDTKMENYNEQYTNKKRTQRIEIEMVTYCVTGW